jgi:hypothetical protein|tara:strand:- start:726 stop:1454 length:729 start_codon:yes stop_codon:yes gene_type:complete
MSYKTEQTWFYYLNGRSIQLYQRSDYGRTDTLGSYKIRLPDDSSGTYFIYPDEDITDGLRIEYTSLATPFVSEALEDMQVFEDGAIISFEDGTGGSSRDIIDFGSSTANDFAVSDKVRVIGSASNDGDYTVVAKGTDGSTGYQQLEVAAGSFTTEAVGESITVYQIPKAVTTSSADESSHINLNRMLSLACLDYLKAMLADREGDIERKEYYMKEFWGKVGDNESNKRKISMSFPSSPYALK